jgi:hypothetical protein
MGQQHKPLHVQRSVVSLRCNAGARLKALYDGDETSA